MNIQMAKNMYSNEIHDFKCPDCGNIIPLARKKSRRRGRGHKKDIFCPFCKEMKTFTEIY